MTPSAIANDQLVVVDACALLSLAAASGLLDDLHRIGLSLAVTPLVMNESRYVWVPGPSGGRLKQHLDLSGLVGTGVLTLIALTPPERVRYVALAGAIDDGEAETCAVAITRDLRIATDDNAAIRLMSSLGRGGKILTTPEIVAHFAAARGMGDGEISTLLRRIEYGANYSPPKTHPLYSWWVATRNASGPQAS